MVTSETELCSNALNFLGEQSITSLTDGTIRANLCKTHYPVLRDALLEEHPWNFAMKRQALAVLADAPEFKWTRQFQLPSDLLRIVDVDPPQTDYEIDGTALACDETAIEVRYVYRITDVTKFPSLFVLAVEFLLASKIAPVLKVDAGITGSMVEMGNMWLRKAKVADAQNQPSQVIDADDLITIRYLP